jgi:hypothetical protein
MLGVCFLASFVRLVKQDQRIVLCLKRSIDFHRRILRKRPNPVVASSPPHHSEHQPRRASVGNSSKHSKPTFGEGR